MISTAAPPMAIPAMAPDESFELEPEDAAGAVEVAAGVEVVEVADEEVEVGGGVLVGAPDWEVTPFGRIFL